jgi:hypothetical protein
MPVESSPQHSNSISLRSTSWGSYDTGSHYRVTTGEDTADWKDLVHAVVNCIVCELAIAL